MTNDRAIFADLMRTIVAVAIVASTTILGYLNVIDATAASAILGSVVGYVGATGAAATRSPAHEPPSTTNVNLTGPTP